MRDDVAETVRAIVADVLDMPVDRLDPDADLAGYGWDSRALLETFAQLESELSVRLDFRNAQAARSVADLLDLLRGDERAEHGPAAGGEPAPEPEAADAGPRVRWREMVRQPSEGALRIALLAGFTVDPLVPHLGVALADRGEPAEVWVAPYGQIEQQCLDPASATARFVPEVLVVAARFEEMWGEGGLPDGDGTADHGADLRYLADVCLDAARRWNSVLAFVLPAVPPVRPGGVGDDGNPAGVGATAARVREELRQRLAGQDGVLVLDAEQLVRAVGERQTYRPEMLATTRIPFSEDYFGRWGEALARLVVAGRRAAAPAVVLDAGSLGLGESHLGTRDDLVSLLAGAARVGTVLAVCDATARQRSVLTGAVPVAAWRSADGNHADQVREIAAQLSVATDRLTFVTASGDTAGSVRGSLPATTVVTLTGEREQWPYELASSGALDVVRRGSAAPSGGTPVRTLDDFLRSLRLDVRIQPLPGAAAEDATDLTRRVAEFHLNGEVWPAERFAGAAVWGIEVSDRFRDHGFSGVVVTHAEQRVLVVDQWVLTCPVLGRGVEERILRRLREHARELGCDTLRFDYRPTGRNEAIQQFLGALAPTPADRAARVDVPVEEADRPAPAAAPVPARGGAVPARRRLRPGPPAGRFTTASSILDAVNARRRDPGAVALDEGPVPRTPAEKALAGVFTTVLRRPVSGVDCNFFDTGDSMQAVQLIAKANQAGYRLTLRQIFQHQTLAALAAVAEQAGEAGAPAGARHLTTAPLLPLQAWFFRLGLPRPGHFNQSQRYEMPADLDVAALGRAIAALLEHHQALRMTFVRTDGGLRQVDPGPPAEPPLEVVDLSGTRPGDRAAAMDAEELRRHRQMSPEDGRLIQFVLFTFGAQEPPRLLLILHHLAIDGVSWRILLDDFQHAYHHALAGAVKLPSIGIPALDWAQRLSDYAQSAEVRAELPVWLAESRRRVRPVPLDSPDGDGSGVFTDFEEILFTAEETRALLDRAVRLDRVSPDVLLLAGANRALAAWTGRGEFLFDVVNHGREPFADGVDLSRTIAWLVMNVPVLFEFDPAQPIEEVAGLVDEQVRRWSGRHGAGDNLLRHLSEDASIRRQLDDLPAADVLFSYAGQVDPHATEFPLFGRQIEGTVPDMDRDAGTPYALQFDAMILGDRMRLEVCYRRAQHRPETARQLLRSWTSDLRGLIAIAVVDGRN